MRRISTGLMVLMALVLTGGMVWASGQAEGSEDVATIRVAAQDVNEMVILGHMAKILIEEQTPHNATINTGFTGSSVLHQAMESNEIDVYPTWTGTQLTGVLRYEGEQMSAEDTWQYVKDGFEEQFGYTWSESLGFNNTYIMVVREETAQEYDLENASDLAGLAENWVLAGDDNFDIRPDAYPGWSEHYGIEFDDVLPMQYGLIYRAVDAGEVDVAAAYSTDSRIARMNLVMLPDDKEFFPAYNGAYVIADEIISDYPDVIDTINSLGGAIDTPTMSALNVLYDDGVEPEDIAREWLSDNGYID
jgi:glycine betaine/choline ABC-type transport system substrate-binding protein